MIKYLGTAINQYDDSASGNAYAGETVTVRDSLTGTKARLYSDNGITEIQNPLNTNLDGSFEFFAVSGSYNIIFSEGTAREKIERAVLNADYGSVFVDDIASLEFCFVDYGTTVVVVGDGYAEYECATSINQIAGPSDITHGLRIFRKSGYRKLIFDTVADMVAQRNLKVGQKVETRGYFSPNDGGGESYEIVAGGSGVDDGGSYIDIDFNGVQAKAEFSKGVFCANRWGLSSTRTPLQNTQALQAAIDYVQNVGGGTLNVLFDTSNYVFAQSESTEEFDDGGVTFSPSDTNAGCCIVVREKVKLKSFGGRAKLVAESPRQSVLWAISPEGSGVRGFDISGQWDGVTGTGHGILQIAKTVGDDTNTDLRIEDNIIHDVASYGIGVQTGNVENCRVRNNITFNTGADGIDVKGRGSAGGETYNIVISGNRIGKFGYRSNLNDQAGIDVRGLAVVRDNTVISVEDVTPDGLVRSGIRCRPGDAVATFGSTLSKVTNNHCESNVRASFRAYAINSSFVKASANTAKTALWGYLVDRNSGAGLPNNQSTISGNSAEDCQVGYATAAGVELTSFSANVDRDCAEGYRLSGNNGIVTAVDSFNATTFVRFVGDNNSIKTGKISGAVTTKIRNDEGGSGNTVVDVDGVRTTQRSQSAAIDISTTGVKTVTVPHSLDVAPTSASQVISSLRTTSTNVDVGLMACTSVNATEATFTVRITTAGTGDLRIVAVINSYT